MRGAGGRGGGGRQRGRDGSGRLKGWRLGHHFDLPLSPFALGRSSIARIRIRRSRRAMGSGPPPPRGCWPADHCGPHLLSVRLGPAGRLLLSRQ